MSASSSSSRLSPAVRDPPHLRAQRDGDDHVVAVGAVLARAGPGFARPGLEVDLVGEGLQVAELGIADDDHVAAPAPVAAVGPAAGDVHLPAKRNAAVPAVPGRHMDLCLIEEHGRRREEASPAARERGPLLGDYADDAPRLAGGELHLACGGREQGVVGADAHVDAGRNRVPRWRTRMAPALTVSPAKALTPRR